ncbi:hypothetical protein NMG60_11025274 [Bertholletia excelsa]
MSRARTYHSHGGPGLSGCRSSFNRSHPSNTAERKIRSYNGNVNDARNHNNFHDYSRKFKEYNHHFNYVKHDGVPSLKRRKFSNYTWEDCAWHYEPQSFSNGPFTCDINSILSGPSRPDANAYTCTTGKRDRPMFEDDDAAFMSRDEIERCSPSRKDGINALHETHLRYTYCAFLQNLGLRLDLPQTTIGTAMVLCHRFFVRRSHACHDRFLIATAALFLAAKSEETARPLNNVLRASSEIFQKQGLTFFSNIRPVDWFEQYRERVIEAEQLILTTLNFELEVQHPYAPLTSILEKLGLSQSVLISLALSLISEGLRSSLWLQFKPHQIAAGATYLAAKYLNMDLARCHNIWAEFQTPGFVLEDVAQQLMELF